MSDAHEPLRRHVVSLLRGRDAHLDFYHTINAWPEHLYGVVPDGLPYSAWQILEHLRIAQWDILEFSRDAAHRSPEWPAGYWPAEPAPRDVGAWMQSVAVFRAELEAMIALVSDPATDLFTPLAHGTGQTVLREALVVADHNAYHVGQLLLIRRLLGAWPAT